MDKKEIIKKGKTFIIQENITLVDFRKEYNQPSYEAGWDKIENSIEWMDNNIKGFAVSDESKNNIWWISKKFFNENYKLVDER